MRATQSKSHKEAQSRPWPKALCRHLLLLSRQVGLFRVTSQGEENSPKVSTQLQRPNCFPATRAPEKYLCLPPSCTSPSEADRPCLLIHHRPVHLKDTKWSFQHWSLCRILQWLPLHSLPDELSTSLHGMEGLTPGLLPTSAASSPSAVPRAPQRDALSLLLPILS